ncbi:MAG: OsmC family peroxiredoxin, partial [Chitinophagaceae bacterium]
MTSKVTYLGDLRTSSIHEASKNEILSDAPVDNHGKGEAFSPTDTVANALGSCVLTTMAIKANQMEFNMEGATAEVTKTMASEP